MPYLVKLTYFKPSGKYYSEGEYETYCKDMYEIFDEVRSLRDELRKLPGLIGSRNYHVLINVPDHPLEYPGLIPLPESS